MQPDIQFSPKRNVLAIGWMSFFWSTGSLMVFSILPVFLTEELGASKYQIGIIEGLCIFIAFATKVLAGVVSDYSRKRKPLIFLGSIFTILVKAMFAMAGSIGFIFAARLTGRIAKGLRSSPTDALIADCAPEKKRATHFGLRQALYTSGAVFGALLATGLMSISGNNYRLVFWLSSIPAFLALWILVYKVKNPPIIAKEEVEGAPVTEKWSLRHIKKLPKQYWLTLFVVGVIISARFSEMFLSLRLREIGWSIVLLPISVVIMDILHSAAAYPTGKLADTRNRYSMLNISLWILILADIVLIMANSMSFSIIGILLIGLHMGISQGLIKALMSASIPFELRGTAFSIFNLVAGLAILLGNFAAGWLSESYEIQYAFAFQAIVTLLAIFTLKKLPKNHIQPS